MRAALKPVFGKSDLQRDPPRYATLLCLVPPQAMRLANAVGSWRGKGCSRVGMRPDADAAERRMRSHARISPPGERYQICVLKKAPRV